MKRWLGPDQRFRSLFIALGLLAMTVAVFGSTVGHDFVNFDDTQYVTENPPVQRGLTWTGVRWAFTTFHASNWHPLTWLSHMLDVEFYGLRPAGHHLTNLLLHGGNVLLLFWVLRRMTGALWSSAGVAALFAVHPLHVESVAWVTERKDVLSTLFWLLTMWSYVRYTEQPSAQRYLTVAVVFAAGLLAKPMLVTLPFVLLLLDYWPLGRFQPGRWSVAGTHRHAWELMKEKLPLLALSAASCVMTYRAQHAEGATQMLGPLALPVRLENAAVTYVTYIGKLLWPHNLAVFYPHPGSTLPLWQVAGAGIALSGVTALVLLMGTRRPYLPVGWFWYLGTLVPVIGLVQVGLQAMADRYTYVPFIGLFIIIVWGASDLAAGWRHHQKVLGLMAGGALALCIAVSWRQVGHWRTSATLFEHALQATTDNYLAHDGLGSELARQGRLEEAERRYREALRIKPDFAEAHNNLGVLLAKQRKFEAAMAHFSEALRFGPHLVRIHSNMGLALAQQGKSADAVAQYMDAIRLAPDMADPYNNLGLVLAQQGRLDEAVHAFREALRLNPAFTQAHINLGLALAQQNKSTEAMAHFSQALAIDPSDEEAKGYLRALQSHR